MNDHYAAQIKNLEEIRDAAQAQLDRIAEGYEFFEHHGSGERVDVTETMAERERRTVASMNALIEGYRKLV